MEKSTNKKINPQKNDAILTAAMMEFGLKGYAKGSTDAIAELADVSKGTVFNYFDSKENLYVTAIQTAYETVLKEYDFDTWNDVHDFAELIVRSTNYKIKLERKYPKEFKIIVHAYSELAILPQSIQEKLGFIMQNSLDLSQKLSKKILGNMNIRKDVAPEIVEDYVMSVMGTMLNSVMRDIQTVPGEITELGDIDKLIKKVKVYTSLLDEGIVAK